MRARVDKHWAAHNEDSTKSLISEQQDGFNRHVLTKEMHCDSFS
jgi:hypothetical protein